MNPITSYAQNREDIIIDAFFEGKQKGFYIDIGANHPTFDSVTKFFYSKGWSGINIEPNETLFNLLKADRKRDTNLNIGVGEYGAKVLFREYTDNSGLSTFSSEEMNNNDVSYASFKTRYNDKTLSVKSLESILDDVNPPKIDFMKIDVEGYEYEAIKGNNWKKYRPELICIEANHIKKDWRSILIDSGYFLLFNDGLNDYFAINESKYAKNFDYSSSVLMRYSKITSYVPHFEKQDMPNIETELPKNYHHRGSLKEVIKGSLYSLQVSISNALVLSIINSKRINYTKRINSITTISDLSFEKNYTAIIFLKKITLKSFSILMTIFHRLVRV